MLAAYNGIIKQAQTEAKMSTQPNAIQIANHIKANVSPQALEDAIQNATLWDLIHMFLEDLRPDLDPSTSYTYEKLFWEIDYILDPTSAKFK